MKIFGQHKGKGHSGYDTDSETSRMGGGEDKGTSLGLFILHSTSFVTPYTINIYQKMYSVFPHYITNHLVNEQNKVNC